MNDRRLTVVATMLAIIGLSGCASGSTAPSASPSSAPVASSPPSPTASSLPSPAINPSPTAPPASEAPVTLESAVYPYSLVVPAHTLTLAWLPAARAWNGTEAINLLGSPVVDKTGIPDGGLVIFGAAAPDGLDGFFEVHAANGSRYHGCGKPTNQRDVTINGDPAIAFVQACLAQQTRSQVSIVHGGFGLGILVSTGAGNEVAALDHLVDLLDGLTWKTP